MRLRSGVEFSWIAPSAQWWLVTASPCGDTKLAVQPPSDTTAFIGWRVRSASSEGLPRKPAALSCLARPGNWDGSHMPSSASAGAALPSTAVINAVESAVLRVRAEVSCDV